MRAAKFAVAAMAALALTSAAQAAILVVADKADAVISVPNSDATPADGGGTVGDLYDTNASIGQMGKNAGDPHEVGTYQCYVMPFKLPDVGPFTAATFDGYTNGDSGYVFRNIVLYGLGARLTADVLGSDFHTGGGTDLTDATLLGSYRYVGESGPPEGTAVSFSDVSLVDFLNAQYAGGAGGKFVFVRMEMESDNIFWHKFNQRTADNVGFEPTLTVTAVPEPTSLAILAMGGIGLFARRRKA